MYRVHFIHSDNWEWVDWRQAEAYDTAMRTMERMRNAGIVAWVEYHEEDR
jgi:hypothetical protein